MSVLCCKTAVFRNIHPGHGGNDPGKTVGDIRESGINLDIAQKLSRKLTERGFDVKMTRITEDGLSDRGENWNKDTDMMIRKNMILSGNYDVFISVHQNSYPDVSCRGGQVFYSDNNPSNAVLAHILQEKLQECAPFENKRTALIDNDYKLLKGNTMPSVIVECGFMSNSAELELLLSEEYCEKIAEYIAAGTEEFVRGMN